MKLIDLEDGAQIVTKDYLDTRLERLQISIDKLENKLDSRMNRLERAIGFAVTASIAQIITALALGAAVVLRHQ
jgi:hypothetical protein